MLKYIFNILLVLFFSFMGFMITLFLNISIYLKKNVEIIKIYDMQKEINTQKEQHYEFYNFENKEWKNIFQQKDTVLFINLWATWCKPCLQEMPNIHKLQNHFKGKKVDFIISSDQSIKLLEVFLQKKTLNLPIYHHKKLPIHLETNTLPTTYIIKNNKLLFSHIGSMNWYNQDIIQLINSEIQ